jgi:hypothetical protein
LVDSRYDGPRDSYDSRKPEASYNSRYDGPRESYDSRKPEASYDSRYDVPRESYDSRIPEASYDSRYDGPRESYDSRNDSVAASQYSEDALAPRPANPAMFSMDSMESKGKSAPNNRYSTDAEGCNVENTDVLETELTCAIYVFAFAIGGVGNLRLCFCNWWRVQSASFLLKSVAWAIFASEKIRVLYSSVFAKRRRRYVEILRSTIKISRLPTGGDVWRRRF